MNEWTLFLGVVALAAAGLAWTQVMIWIPAHLRSLYRYKLWRLRDGVVDDLIFRRLPDRDLVRALVHSIEFAIRESRNLTFCQWMALPLLSEEARRAIAQQEARQLESFSLTGRELYLRRQAGFISIMTRHLVLGSPSSWVASGFAIAAGAVSHVLGTLRKQWKAKDFRSESGDELWPEAPFGQACKRRVAQRVFSFASVMDDFGNFPVPIPTGSAGSLWLPSDDPNQVMQNQNQSRVGRE